MTLRIALAADANYAPHSAAMIHSLVTHQPAGLPIEFYFLHYDEFPAPVLTRLSDLAGKLGARFVPLPIATDFLPWVAARGRFAREAWLRLLLPQLLPQFDRILYVDADTIVNDDLRPLWETDLNGSPVAAVANALMPKDQAWPQFIGMQPGARYFNSGVLLMDLRRWHQEDVIGQVQRFVEIHPDKLLMADQDPLNVIFEGRWLEVPLRWNLIGSYFYNVKRNIELHGLHSYQYACRQPGIIHYTGGAISKPWHRACMHPRRQLYFDHLKQAGWPPPPMVEGTLKERLRSYIPLPLYLGLKRLQG